MANDKDILNPDPPFRKKTEEIMTAEAFIPATTNGHFHFFHKPKDMIIKKTKTDILSKYC